MNLQEIRDIAQTHGLKTSKLNKVNLVRLIQSAEGNFDCFATAASGFCDQDDCSWRNDCFSLAAKKSN